MFKFTKGFLCASFMFLTGINLIAACYMLGVVNNSERLAIVRLNTQCGIMTGEAAQLDAMAQLAELPQ